MKKRYLILTLIILSICSIFIGVKDISFVDIFKSDDVKLKVLLISRIPRLISIIIVGATMSIAGLIMQQISRNKFVSPDTASTVDSAKLGILVALMIFPSATLTEKMIVSFIFSLLGTFLFMKILKKIKAKNSIFIPLVGIMLGNIIDSITTFFAYKYNLIQSIASWLQGDFSLIIKGNYELIYLSLPLVVISFIYANKFTVAGMGEDFSKNLGVNYNRIINMGLVIVALISSLVVITVGKIPFLGLIVPNIVTLYKGDNLKNSIWITALLGAVFLLGCDILGRLIIYPYEISIGLVVGVIGSIVFLYLLFRRNGNEV
ncbi:ABC transporter permease [Clostridium sporogenes]|uniref:ABC transporter permease n=4 Tax=Clostridium TaxID=1485 RepID=A0A7X5PDB2_CLOSG|nr:MULTISPECIES: ABC transporter permease [Clostridium]AJD32113.1 fecCD transport family protein [Clostridium botulinum Prevot_594]AVP59814.1 iron ABC transporter permease [Clostridium botulinum]AKC61772.1 iron chelate uptake ABC transporter permease [Clostridium sporogenes]AKJ89081.1 iron ABC transporter permease [Clostridium sporogenes]AVP64661.1 iron ABC transporter permease [Clostridium botulinum]